jgi:hypothetical protein
MSYFPTSVPTALQLLEARNNRAVTLDGAINDVITTIPVLDTSDIPTSGYLTFADGSNECISYTGVTATSLTGCTRGADGTTAANHGDGAQIGLWQNAKYHNILTDEIVGICQNLNDRLGLTPNQIRAISGSPSLPSYSFGTDIDTGIYLPTVGSIELVCGGNGQVTWVNNSTMRPTANNQLDLGQPSYRWGNAYAYRFRAIDFMEVIQNSATDAYLHLEASSSGNSANVRLKNSAGVIHEIGIETQTDVGGGRYPGPASSLNIYAAGNNDIYFSINGSNVYTLTTNAGSGTQALFRDGSAAIPVMSFTNDSNTGFFRYTTDGIGVSNGGVTKAIFYADLFYTSNSINVGYVGGNAILIQSSSPANDLGLFVDNQSTAANSNARVGLRVADTTSGDPYILFTVINGSPSAWSMGVDNSDGDKFKINNSSFLGVGSTLEINISNQVLFNDGGSSQPTISFSGDTDTGFFRYTGNIIGATCGASTAQLILAGATQFPSGSSGSPSVTFINDSNSGIYSVGADQLGFVTAGVRAFFIGTDGSINMDTGHNINIDHGTVAAPGVRGGADPNTGIYIPSADVLAFSCGGFESARFKNVSGNDDTSHAIMNMWGGGNSAVTTFIHYTTTNITTAKQIALLPNNTCLVVVAGNDGSTNFFRDLVMAGYGGTPTVIVSTTESGSPSARTYSNAGAGVFRVAMASGTYKTQTFTISVGGR